MQAWRGLAPHNLPSGERLQADGPSFPSDQHALVRPPRPEARRTDRRRAPALRPRPRFQPLVAELGDDGPVAETFGPQLDDPLDRPLLGLVRGGVPVAARPRARGAVGVVADSASPGGRLRSPAVSEPLGDELAVQLGEDADYLPDARPERVVGVVRSTSPQSTVKTDAPAFQATWSTPSWTWRARAKRSSLATTSPRSLRRRPQQVERLGEARAVGPVFGATHSGVRAQAHDDVPVRLGPAPYGGLLDVEPVAVVHLSFSAHPDVHDEVHGASLELLTCCVNSSKELCTKGAAE